MALVNAPRLLRLSSSGRYPSKSKSDCILGSSAPKLPMSKRSMVVLLILSLILLVLHSIYPYRKSPFLATHSLPPEHTAPANLQVPQNPGLQNVLVHLATVDLGERVMAQQVSVLLDEAWKPSLVDQLLDSIQLGRDERGLLEGARSKLAKEGHSIPAQLLNPWYARLWGQISNSVRSWVDGRRVYDPHIMFSVLRAVKDRIDKHYIKLAGDNNAESVELGRPYRSCAVVGNSGILLNSNYSSLIDSHQAVIRLNNARTAGFEQHVGGKTTLAFINSNLLQACAGRSRCFCQPYGDHVPILLYMCHPAHFLDLTLCSESQKAPILVTDPRLDTLCARIAKYYSLRVFVETTGRRPDEWSDARDGPFFHYSSGMQAVLVALGFCRQVSLFGFGKSPGAKHHYHTNQQSELHLHDYAAEYQLYHDLQHNTSLVPFLSESGFSLPPLHVYS